MKNKSIFKKIIQYNYQAFPFLVVLTYTLLIIETYTYVGFLRRYLVINSRGWLLLVLISGLIIIISKGERKHPILESIYNFLYPLNLLLFPSFLVFGYIINAVEAAHYPNYVFSSFHLQPQNFSPIILLSGFVIFTQFCPKIIERYLYKTKLIKPIELLSMLLIIPLTILFSYENATISITGAIKGDAFVIQNIDMSYDDKMKYTWGGFFYEYMNFIKNNTSENSTIAIPPQESPWLSTGNAGLVRYFLYPRFVINGGYDFLPNKKFEYVLIAKGEWLTDDKSRYGWPKIPVSAEKLVYFNPKTFEASESAINYNPLDSNHKDSWGLIKIKENLE